MLMVLFQGLPWVLTALFFRAPEGHNLDGTRNLRNALVWNFTAFGGAVNAIVISIVVIGFSTPASATISSVYITLWSTVWLIESILEIRCLTARDRDGNPMSAQAYASFWAFCLSLFGVNVNEYRSPNQLWLIDLLAIFPSIAVGFITSWFLRPSYDMVCAAGLPAMINVSNPMKGDIFRSTDAVLQTCYSVSSGQIVCCAPTNSAFNVADFISYLAGPMLTAFQFVKGCAKVILRSQTIRNYGVFIVYAGDGEQEAGGNGRTPENLGQLVTHTFIARPRIPYTTVSSGDAESARDARDEPIACEVSATPHCAVETKDTDQNEKPSGSLERWEKRDDSAIDEKMKS